MASRIGLLLLTLILLAVSLYGLASSNSLSAQMGKTQDSGVAPTQTQSPPPSPTPSPTPCPTVAIAASTATEPGESISATATVSGSDETDVLYTWTVIGGQVVSGNGTSSIEIVASPDVQQVTLNIEVQIDSCTASASITVTVANIPPSDFGILEGIVRDPQNRRLDGATVTVFLGNNSTAQEITKNGGRYRFDRLIVGQHNVEASHSGFGPDRQMVTITKDQTTRKNFKLK
jgi:hypothetical protein